MTEEDLRATPDIQLDQEVPASRERVHALLTDLRALAPLHPLIESIEAMPGDPDRPGAVFHRVTDRFVFGPLRFRTRYVAALEPLGPECVRGDAWQSPGVRLRTLYHLEALSEATTRIREEVRVEAPFGMRGFVVRQAREAHRRMLADLAAAVADGTL